MRNKILFVVTRPPYPATDGTRERILNELKSLSADFLIDLLIIGTEDMNQENRKYLAKITGGNIFTFKISKIKASLRSLAKIFSNKPLQSAYFLSLPARHWLEEKSHQYQIIHFHTLRFGPYLERLKKNIGNRGARLLLNFNDAISLNYLDAAKKAKGLWRLIYYLEAKRVRNYELKMLELAEGFSIVSSRDQEYILNNWKIKHQGKQAPEIQVIRHIIEDEIFSYQYQPETENLVFIGNLFYPPNKQGLEFFCKNIWPEIKKVRPEIKFIIIGRGGQESFSSQTGIETLGFVQDPYPVITKQALFISPADFGAGVPTKTLLAMSLGIPVVSTGNNAAGIDGIADGENICLIDYQEKSRAAAKILELLADKDRMRGVGAAGKILAEEKYRQSKNYQTIKEFLINERI